MAIIDNDIKLFYSGGVQNSNPDLCLGGEMSTYFFTSNRLFDNITADQSVSGDVTYRCVYFYNTNTTDTFYNAKIYISNEVENGSNVLIGLEKNNERQSIYITNATSVSSGNFVLQYFDYFADLDITIFVNHNPNISIWALNFQNSIKSISGLEDVVVSGSLIGTTAFFEINFNGSSNSRYYELLQLVSLSQTFLDVNASLSVIKSVNGSPKLKLANEISSELSTPFNVIFAPSSLNYPIEIGNLKALEYCAVWIKRIVSANTSSLEGDGFTIKIKGETL